MLDTITHIFGLDTEKKAFCCVKIIICHLEIKTWNLIKFFSTPEWWDNHQYYFYCGLIQLLTKQNELIQRFYQTTSAKYCATNWTAVSYDVNKSLNLVGKLQLSKQYFQGKYYNGIRWNCLFSSSLCYYSLQHFINRGRRTIILQTEHNLVDLIKINKKMKLRSSNKV